MVIQGGNHKCVFNPKVAFISILTSKVFLIKNITKLSQVSLCITTIISKKENGVIMFVSNLFYINCMEIGEISEKIMTNNELFFHKIIIEFTTYY